MNTQFSKNFTLKEIDQLGRIGKSHFLHACILPPVTGSNGRKLVNGTNDQGRVYRMRGDQGQGWNAGTKVFKSKKDLEVYEVNPKMEKESQNKKKIDKYQRIHLKKGGSDLKCLMPQRSQARGPQG